MDNFDLRLRKWIRYELACRKIQRCFRQWCMHRMLYRRIKLNGMKRLNRSYDISDSKGKIDISKQSTDNFQAILKQTANFQSKCAFWMKVIDLKRMFPEKSADLLLRSLIESQGDINRAQILLGSSDFVFQNAQPLPGSVRAIFVPQIGPFEQQSSKYDIKFTKLLLLSTHRFAKSSMPSDVNDTGTSQRQSKNSDLIRSLRTQFIQQQKQDLINTFLKVIEKSYFGNQLQKGRPLTAKTKSSVGEKPTSIKL